MASKMCKNCVGFVHNCDFCAENEGICTYHPFIDFGPGRRLTPVLKREGDECDYPKCFSARKSDNLRHAL